MLYIYISFLLCLFILLYLLTRQIASNVFPILSPEFFKAHYGIFSRMQCIFLVSSRIFVLFVHLFLKRCFGCLQIKQIAQITMFKVQLHVWLQLICMRPKKIQYTNF